MPHLFHRTLMLGLTLALVSCAGGKSSESKDASNLAADTSVHEDTHLEIASSSDTEKTDTLDSQQQDATDPAEEPKELPQALGGDRPAPYYLPESYDPAVPLPVLVMLHGFTANGGWTANWWGLSKAANDAGILLIIPEGTKDLGGNPFWNATNFCCDFYGSKVDDVGYITGLIEEAMVHFPVNPERVYLMGHSNGGFMSHRIACDRSDLIGAIVNMGGATWFDPEACPNPGPVSVLQVHGSWDTTILYDGLSPVIGDPQASPTDANKCLSTSCDTTYNSCLANESCSSMVTCFGECSERDTGGNEGCIEACWSAGTATAQFLWMETWVCGLSSGCYMDPTQTSAGYASTEEGARRWAHINGCDDSSTEFPPIDLVTELAGQDTYPKQYEGCPEGLASDIWKILYGSHVPRFNDSWGPAVMEWLLAQHK